MKKRGHMLLSAIVVAVFIFCFSGEAFPWGAAAHLYVVDRASDKTGQDKLEEYYGSNGPDAFNYLFAYPQYRDYLYNQTHNEFEELWSAAETHSEKALAFGFLSHNDVWGADYTAHHGGTTFGKKGGYVIANARTLKAILEPSFMELGIPDEVALEISHDFLEYGVDILVTRLDPNVGQKLIASATYGGVEFPGLLLRTYGEGLAGLTGDGGLAAAIILGSEQASRDNLVAYGYALSLGEEQAIKMFSVRLASLAEIYLAMYGVTLPEGADIMPLIERALKMTTVICSGTVKSELDNTAEFVRENLAAYGAAY
jgi:hypothetical protein